MVGFFAGIVATINCLMLWLTSGSTDIGGALETAFGTIVSDALDAIAGILPIVLPILGATSVIIIGIKVFKKLRSS